MPTLNGSTQKGRSFNTQEIQRAIWIVLTALIVSVILFGGYYYWDRYVRLKDKSPMEMDIERLEQAIREDPQNPDARVALAEYYLRSGMPQKALEQANQVLKVYPEHEGALLIAGIAYVRLNQPEASLAPLEKFVELRKDRPMAGVDTALETAYYFLGESYVKLNRPEDAIPVLEAALKITPTDADALYQAGVAYQATGELETALERYHRAVRLVPDFLEAYQGMVESYSALNQPDYVVYAQGMEAFCRKDYQTAQDYLEQATEALPDFAPAFLGLGLTYEQMGDLEAALAAVERALELQPNDFAILQARGRIQAALDSKK